MKKYLLIFSIILSSIGVGAQTLTLIPKIGVTFSTISKEYDENIKPKPGFTFGAGVDYGISKIFSIQSELNFIQKGYLEESSSTWSDFLDDFEGTSFTTTEINKTKLTTNYLEIPVLIKIMVGNNTRFFFNAGPSIGIGLGGKRIRETNETTVYNYLDGDESETFSNTIKRKVKFGTPPNEYEGSDWYIDNRIDFGLQLGGGVLISQKIIFEVRYGLGLSNLYDPDNNAETKNRVFQFTAGIPLQPK